MHQRRRPVELTYPMRATRKRQSARRFQAEADRLTAEAIELEQAWDAFDRSRHASADERVEATT